MSVFELFTELTATEYAESIMIAVKAGSDAEEVPTITMS